MHKTALTLASLFIIIASPLIAQELQPLGLPAFSSTVNENGETQYSLSLQVLALMTAITVIPSLLLGMTSFTRIIIVLSILRQALGTQQTPPNQVLIAIALFLSFYIMAPALTVIYETSINPYLDGIIGPNIAIENASDVIYTFLIANTRPETITIFAELRGITEFSSQDEVPFSILLPSFITSELKTAFQIGFLLFLPFLVIDMVIASLLMSLGMMMLSPMLIALPFKLLLFVLVDGWGMTIGSLAATFQV